MAADISGILASLPELIRQMPLIVWWVQNLFYFSLILTFGSIVIRGYRGYINPLLRFPLRLFLGFVALVCGFGISPYIPYLSSDVLVTVLQDTFINVIIGGLVSAVVLFLGVALMTHNIFNVNYMKKQIEKLQNLVKKAEEIKRKEKDKSRIAKIFTPIRIIGIVLTLGFISFSLISFTGFPNLLSELGITETDLNNIANTIENIKAEYGDELNNILESPPPADCIKAASLINNLGSVLESKMQPYTDITISNEIKQRTGESVNEMYRIDYENQTIIIAMTESKYCVAVEEGVCACEDISEILDKL